MAMDASLSRQGTTPSAVRESAPVVSMPAAAPAPVIARPTVAEIPWTRIDLDLYEVARDGYIVGYVEVVGAVFVALGGARYDRAVEVSQHLTFHAAVEALVRRVI